MRNKFDFLTTQSIKNKLSTNAFKIANIFLLIIIVIFVNADSIIKSFGGDFEELVNVYVVDEVGVYDEFKSTMDNNYLEILENYNAEISLYQSNFEKLKESINENSTRDIIIHIKRSGQLSYDNIFDVEIISYGFIDSILYNNIVTALNTTKRSVALKEANISQELLNVIDKPVEVDRIILDEELNANEEFMKVVGALIMGAFILPIFLLIIYVIQMIGAEINEEKSSKSMEIIISSVTPETHFISKLVSTNLFAIIQGALLVLYLIIGVGVRVATAAPLEVTSVVNTFSQANESLINSEELEQMINDSSIITRITSGLPLIVVLIILTFVAYTLFTGILASVTTTMEDFNQILTPVMIVLMMGYLLSIYSAVFSGSIFIKIMSYVPFISGILSPVVYVLGQISLLDVCISIAVLLGIIFLLYKYGLKVYKVGILNYSSSNLWKKIFKALKD